MADREYTLPEEKKIPDAELVDGFVKLIERGDQNMAVAAVLDLYPADAAQVLTHLHFELASKLFHWLPEEPAADVLAELDDDYRAELLEKAPRERLTGLLDELDTDDAADVLLDLPEKVAQEVLPTLKEAEDVEELLQYPEDTAGGIMGTEYVAVSLDSTVEQATEAVRAKAEIVEKIYAVYLTDDTGCLKGFVTLKRLLLSPANFRMADIVKSDVISVPTSHDQEEVGRIMERYNLISLPVVDEEERLVGRITIDDVVEVIREEHEEDILRMSGVSGGEGPTDSVLEMVRGRLPWLLAGLVGAGLAAMVISFFEDAIREATMLAAFIPIVMATAGNAGIQSSAIAVQGLAVGEIWSSDISGRLAKELMAAVLNGVVVALALSVGIIALSLTIGGIRDPYQLALTASMALVAVIVLAASIGATIPLLLERLNVDPAIATGPFITTSNDIMGILVFFLLADHFYLV